MTRALTGHCLCRAVTYDIDPPLGSITHCHCESCRRSASAAFVTWASAPATSLRITSGSEALTAFPSSPGARRSFCGRCGSQLFMLYDAEPEVAYVTFASLADPGEARPHSHVSFEERVSWFPFEDALPKRRAKTEDPAD